MTSPLSVPLSPEADSSELARRDLQARLSGLGRLNNGKTDEAQKEKKLREACEGFESIFIQKMWQEMRNTLPKTNILQGREEQFWQGMYDQELAKKMTSAGGIGLADMMYAQLSQGLSSASRTSAAAAPQGGMRAFVPDASPLVPRALSRSAAAAEDGQASQAGSQPASPSGRQPGHPLGNTPGMQRDAGAAAHTEFVGAQSASAEAAQRQPGPEGMFALPDSGQTEAQPSVVEQALSVLRAQKDMQYPAQQAPHVSLSAPGRGERTDPGLALSRQAHFEAGSKLGPRGVRPPLRKSAAPAEARAPLAAQGAGSHVRTQNLNRELHVDAVGPNSKAGAGLAAYHAQRDAPMPEAGLPLAGFAGSAQPTAVPAGADGEAAGRGGEMSSFPPLTALDLQR
ncbi:MULTISPECIES: rod-binding protein [unclassified Desulfovibrio]|uniref:rod-binding protein n=1 Tax=unclassified Desulfovibrio TaxID=2593640 RepID=UPI000F5EE655|nr:MULTISPECIES: rod-binding protein [unclassified Desulfovibrio]RRD70627.1 hypothetical protein EII24_06050 [Desulfovibrio sp. OH1209_COT-279]RRD87056.1 hypothetical protein EII23_06050 [Desulfovibrio sp. OH1186_COT-070]